MRTRLLRNTVVFLLLFAFCFSISSCDEIIVPEPPEAASQQILSTQTAHLATPTIPPINLKDYSLKGQESFIRLSSLAMLSGYDIYSADFYDDKTLVILYVAPKSGAYKIGLLSLTDGQLTFKASGTLGRGDNVSSMAITPISARPFIFADNNAIYAWDANFSAETRVDCVDWDAVDYAYSPAEKCIYYLTRVSNYLYRYDFGSQKSQPLFTDSFAFCDLRLNFLLKNGSLAVLNGFMLQDFEAITLLVDTKTGKLKDAAFGNLSVYEVGNLLYAVNLDGSNPEGNEGSTIINVSIGQNGFERDMSGYALQHKGIINSAQFSGSRLHFYMDHNYPVHNLYALDLANKGQEIFGELDISALLTEKNDTSSDADLHKDAEYFYNGLMMKSTSAYSSTLDMYLLLIGSSSGVKEILLWDLASASPSDQTIQAANYTALSTYVPKQPVDYGANSKYAAEISQKYGVKVFIGENAAITDSDFNVEVLTDMQLIYEALKSLDEALALYPEGFFTESTTELVKSLNFYLTGSITAKGNNTISVAEGLANTNTFSENILLNAESYRIQENVCHEICHVIDRKLETLVYVIPGLLWEFEEWNSFNPPGFNYYYSYTDKKGVGYNYSASTKYTADDKKYWRDNNIESVYFVTGYSKTFPIEDRATLMEVAMTAVDMPSYMYSPHIQKKLKYFFAAIRAAWDTAEWPAVTSWERALTETTKE